MQVFCRLKVVGQENIENLESGFILASNHVSEIDAAFVRAALPFFSRYAPLYFVANPKDKFSHFGWRSLIYGGTLFKLLGAYPVYRGVQNYALALEHHLKLLHEKRNVCIYPEGGRTHDGKLREAHGGVAFLSKTVGAPVVPLAINGLYGMTFKDFFLRKRTVTVRIGPALRPADIVPEAQPEVPDYKRGATLVLRSVDLLLEKEAVHHTGSPIIPVPAPVTVPASSITYEQPTK
jgi:1-acyl-sn-glycerol-3-phosphate acyltransferase